MAAPEIVSYDPSWPSVAQTWIRRIASALSASGVDVLSAEHIGSTAVPGLAAKPYVDIQVLVKELPDEEVASAALVSLGFSRARGSREDSPGVDFDIPRPGSDPRHHEKLLYLRELDTDPFVRGLILHVRLVDSAFADFVRSFCDWLRSAPASAAEYEYVKRGLAVEHADAADYDDYTRAKGDFMDEAQRAMGWPRA